jgi:hypothetical protein
VYIDTSTSLPLKQATFDNGGKKTIEIYDSADFNAMGLV